MRILDQKINTENIFCNDKLEREYEVKIFRKLIVNAKGPYVVSVDAPWGTGKTYFVNLIRHDLEDEIETIYVNAWESDYTSDPMITLVSELKNITSKVDFKRVKEKFLKVSKLVIPSAIKIASSGLIDIKNISAEVSEVGEKIVLEKFKSYEAEKNSITELKNELENLAKESKNEKIVIFIDELDRCRPSYAIEFLERVKHFFDVEGYIFVLSIDQDQLLESIKTLYGANFESEKYIRRFIDFKYHLKQNISKRLVEDNFKRIGCYDFIRTRKGLGIDKAESAIETIYYLSILGGLTARDINQIISKLNLLLISLPEDKNIILLRLVIVLVILRHLNDDLFKKYINKEISPDEVIGILNLQSDKYNNYGQVNKLNAILSGLILLQIRGTEIKSQIFDQVKTEKDKTENEEISYSKEYSKLVFKVMQDYSLNTFDYVSKQVVLK